MGAPSYGGPTPGRDSAICLDVVTGNLRMLQITLSNIRTTAKYSCLINDPKSPFISLNVTVLAIKNLRTNL